jgi:hypothetical protein
MNNCKRFRAHPEGCAAAIDSDKHTIASFPLTMTTQKSTYVDSRNSTFYNAGRDVIIVNCDYPFNINVRYQHLRLFTAADQTMRSVEAARMGASAGSERNATSGRHHGRLAGV